MKELHTNTLLLIVFTLFSVGQFNKTNGQSQLKFQAVFSHQKTDDHIAEWDYYFSNVDEKMSSIFVDLGLYKAAPLKDKPNFVWVSFKLNNARQEGFSSSGKSELPAEIEDNLIRKIEASCNSIYVGRLTSNGCSDLYFYVEDSAHYEKALSEVMGAYPEYPFEYGEKADEKWSGYFDFIYPPPQQFQSIQNRRIIDQLEKSGDKLTKLRKVDHWIFFKTKRDRDLFLNKIMFDGFTIVTRDYDKKSGGLPYKLHIKRIDKVDWNSVDAYVIYLWKLANDYNGVYDGWETTVEKD